MDKQDRHINGIDPRLRESLHSSKIPTTFTTVNGAGNGSGIKLPPLNPRISQQPLQQQRPLFSPPQPPQQQQPLWSNSEPHHQSQSLPQSTSNHFHNDTLVSNGRTATPSAPQASPAPSANPLPNSSINSPNTPRRGRACDTCRGFKVRCDPDPSGGPCKRCAKSGKVCRMASPRQRRRRKNEGRVAELERRIDALTQQSAALTATIATNLPASNNAGGQVLPPLQSVQRESPEEGGLNGVATSEEAAARTAAQHHFRAPWSRSVAPEPQQTHVNGHHDHQDQDMRDAPEPASAVGPERFQGYQKGLQELQDTIVASCSTRQKVDDILNTMDQDFAQRLLDHYRNVMSPTAPSPTISNAKAKKLRTLHSLLYGVIMTVASEQLAPDLYRMLWKPVTSEIAENIYSGEDRSEELVQCLQILAVWHWRGGDFSHYEINLQAAMTLMPRTPYDQLEDHGEDDRIDWANEGHSRTGTYMHGIELLTMPGTNLSTLIPQPSWLQPDMVTVRKWSPFSGISVIEQKIHRPALMEPDGSVYKYAKGDISKFLDSAGRILEVWENPTPSRIWDVRTQSSFELLDQSILLFYDLEIIPQLEHASAEWSRKPCLSIDTARARPLMRKSATRVYHYASQLSPAHLLSMPPFRIVHLAHSAISFANTSLASAWKNAAERKTLRVEDISLQRLLSHFISLTHANLNDHGSSSPEGEQGQATRPKVATTGLSPLATLHAFLITLLRLHTNSLDKSNRGLQHALRAEKLWSRIQALQNTSKRNRDTPDIDDEIARLMDEHSGEMDSAARLGYGVGPYVAVADDDEDVDDGGESDSGEGGRRPPDAMAEAERLLRRLLLGERPSGDRSADREGVADGVMIRLREPVDDCMVKRVLQLISGRVAARERR